MSNSLYTVISSSYPFQRCPFFLANRWRLWRGILKLLDSLIRQHNNIEIDAGNQTFIPRFAFCKTQFITKAISRNINGRLNLYLSFGKFYVACKTYIFSV